MGNKRDATGTIKSLAKELGFDMVGVSAAERLNDASLRLSEWLSRGYQSTMEWMNRNVEKRIDPRSAMEGAQSVISLAKNYYVPIDHGMEHLKISRYAWGEDYHFVIGKMLEGLVAKLNERFQGNRFVYYCDTGPVMEKVWAQRSGIGWIGKNTNLINSRTGSWLFLSEVITDLECEGDLPETDHCGTCRACIDACPTEAIVEPYVLDSGRCISYLTIENKDHAIPAEYASRLDNWVFGCDICQDVCPWNAKFQTPTNEAAFHPREENLNLDCREAHLMTREEFSKRFRRSPVKRSRYDGFVRNIIAIRNSVNSSK